VVGLFPIVLPRRRLGLVEAVGYAAARAVKSASFYQANSAGLRFDFENDALRHATEIVEDYRRRFRARKLTVLHRQVNSELEVVVKFNTALNARVWDFIFRAIPPRVLIKSNTTTPSAAFDFAAMSGASNQGNKRMFAQISEIVDGPEIVIPSWVWLKRSKQRLDFCWNILRGTPHSVLELAGIPGEGENAEVQIRIVGSEVGSGPNGMIEACSDVFDNLSCKQTPPEGKPLSQANFINVVSGISRVRLDNLRIWFLTKKTVTFSFESVEVFLCSCKPELGAVEGVIVDQWWPILL
jgi:hypothetical protein